MPILLTIVVLLAANELLGYRIALVLGLISGLAGLYIQFSRKIRSVESEVSTLRQALQIEREQRRRQAGTDGALAADASPGEPAPGSGPQAAAGWQAADSPGPDAWRPGAGAQSRRPGWTRGLFDAAGARSNRFIKQALALVGAYFSDGNLFVRVGILVLFVGVAFLLKYAAEHSSLPVELRFLGAALGGLALLAIGWRLRLSRRPYALLLQGAGVGITYITIFAAYQLQNLIPAGPAFGLLAAFAAFTAPLAMIQNAPALAVFGILGGFLAPLLTASGSGNHLGLFSYYLLLDLAVLGIAWVKAWRPLNLVGFAFTFGVFTLWTVRSYQPGLLAEVEPFLLLFFLVYSAIGILYAFRQPLQLKGYVDASLVFGTPLVAFSLQAALVRHSDYGIALSAAGFGLYYVGLARILWQRQGEGLRLLAESMLAVGVIFVTLAIPYALDGHWTTATWALEAAGILWVAIRQGRRYTRYFALALQLGAGLLFLARNADDFGDTAFINPAFMGGVFLALGGLTTAWLLYRLHRQQPGDISGRLHLPFFLWGLAWWLGSALLQTAYYVENVVVALLLLCTATAYAFMHLSIQRRWHWRPADVCSALLVPTLLLIALFAVARNQHALLLPDALYWAAAMALGYYLLWKLESDGLAQWWLEWLYTTWLVTVTLLLSIELDWRFADLTSGAAVGGGWRGVMIALPTLVLVHAVRRFEWGALARLGAALRNKLLATLGLAAGFWSVHVNLGNPGETTPLPYLPLVNPLDLVQALFLLFALRFLLDRGNPPGLRRLSAIPVGALGFVWINSVLLRGLHHYAGIPYDLESMAQSITAQISISILWTVLGCLAMLLASRRGWRALWVVGGGLVGIVLLKMTLIDLDASGTIERIVSFLVVGGLLVGMGYYSPLPKKTGESAPGTGNA